MMEDAFRVVRTGVSRDFNDMLQFKLLLVYTVERNLLLEKGRLVSIEGTDTHFLNWMIWDE